MKKVLVFAGGEVHDFKGCGGKMYEVLKQLEGLEVSYLEEDLNVLVPPGLEPYDLLVFYYTLGKLTDQQKNGLLNWVASGKKFIGIHSAADSFRECPEYRSMIGGHFVTHPAYRQYQISCKEHPITKGIEDCIVTDEQYILAYDPRVNVIGISIYKGSTTPVVWTKKWEEGKVVYIALGHDPKACEQEAFKKLLTNATKWILE